MNISLPMLQTTLKKGWFTLSSIIKLMRPKHWVKNLFIFLPVFFAGQLSIIFSSIDLMTAFFSFSMAASAVYIFNDLLDVEKDKLHPTKKKRPIASGKITKPLAICISTLLAIIALSFSFLVNIQSIIGGYILLNILYTLSLKHIAIVDVSIISIGFVLRVLAGGIVANVLISKWIIIMTFLLAMFLAFGKRRDELLVASTHKEEKSIRPALSGYNLEFINLCLICVSVIIIIAYMLYCMSAEVIERMGTEKIYFTSFFVILGILRFLQIIIVEKKSGSPTEILWNDRFIQSVLIGWLGLFGYLIYVL